MTDRTIGASSLIRLLGTWRVRGGNAAYRQLAGGLRLLILDGRLPLGVRIPGERDLAEALDVSRTTVSTAFALLRDEGYLSSRQGSGSRTTVPDAPADRPLPDPERIGEGVLDLVSAALPANASVHRAYSVALSNLPLHLSGHGYDRVGLIELRRVIADRYTKRGCPTAPDQIMVTHGAQHAVALMLRLLAGPGDRVVIDHPTYPHAIDAILQASCRPVPVGLPEHGWDIDALVNAFRQVEPRMVYLVPDFHNPTGRCMDADTRARVADAAARHRTIIVADETMADLWIDAPPPPSLASYDRAGTVVTLGSTGKSFWGGLRIGWIRAEAEMIAALARIRSALDLGTPILEQMAATQLLADDAGDLSLRRQQLRVQRDALIAAVHQRLPGWRAVPPPGGLALWAELPRAFSTALAATSEAHGVRISAGPRFGIGGAFERNLRLPFSLPVPAIEEAIRRLASADEALSSAKGAREAAFRETGSREALADQLF